MKFLSILTKISAVWIVIMAFCTVNLQKVNAQDLSATISYDLNIAIDSGFTAQVDLKAGITNTSQELIDTLSLTIPFKHAILVSAVVNNVVTNDVTVTADEYPQVTLSFGTSIIKPGQTGSVELIFTTPKLVTTKLGINTLYIPKIQGNYQISQVNYNINLDPSLPEMIFSSVNSTSGDSNRLLFSTTQAVLLQWAGNLRWDFEDVIYGSGLAKGSKSAVNLVPQISGQVTDYISILDYPIFAGDRFHNLWMIDDMTKDDYQFDYTVKVSKSVTSVDNFVTPNLDKFQIPLHEDIQGEDLTKLESIYKYTIANFAPDTNSLNKSVEDLDQLNNKIKAKSKLTAFESSIVLARFLQQVNIPSRVVYGFVLIPAINNFDPAHAHVWVEAKVGDSIYTLDPALSNDINVDWVDKQGLNRLVMGVWDPNNSFDSALGLLTNSPKTEMKSTILDATDIADAFSLSAYFPANAYSGQFYSGKIVLANSSNKFLDVSSIQINNDDIPLTSLKLSTDLSRLVPPYGSLELKLDDLQLGNIFYDGDFTKTISVALSNPGFSTQSTQFTIHFIPNLGLMLVLILLGLAVALTFLTLLTRHRILVWYNHKRGKLTPWRA